PTSISFLFSLPPPPRSTLFPYTTLFRSDHQIDVLVGHRDAGQGGHGPDAGVQVQLLTKADVDGAEALADRRGAGTFEADAVTARSEEHTSELQSQSNLVCRLLLEKKKNK